MVARYGVEDRGGWDLREKVEKLGSPVLKAWWRIDRGKGKFGSIFKEKLKILVGKGDRTLFGHTSG